MKRQPQLLLAASTIAVSWLSMQIVHETGHMAAAWATGGQITEVKLHPVAISVTLVANNRQPLVVAWMGPLAGVGLPLLAWAVARWKQGPGWYVVQFFAGFCLVANGAYLLGGSIYQMGDAGDLMRLGTPPPLLWLFGTLTIPAGFWLWNGLGPHFGFGQSAGVVDRTVAFVVSLLLLVIVCVGTRLRLRTSQLN